MRRRAGATVMAGLVCLTACSPPEEEAQSPAPARPGLESRAERDKRWDVLEGQLNDLADEVHDEFAGVPGIVVTDGVHTAAAGAEGTHSVWSTIKVPIAIAATQHGTGDEDLIDLAITESDNDASWLLWNSLGDTEEAALKVEQVLTDGGGPGDVYDIVVNTSGNPTGNAEWTLKEQAKFATNMQCLDGAEKTVEAMGEIVEWQRDGLGTIEGARFKGGWSDEHLEDSFITYTYRQFGSIGTEDGVIGVAILAYPDDGTHDTAADMLDAVAAGVEKLIDADAIPAGRGC